MSKKEIHRGNLAKSSYLVSVFVSLVLLSRCVTGYEILAFEKPCLYSAENTNFK